MAAAHTFSCMKTELQHLQKEGKAIKTAPHLVLKQKKRGGDAAAWLPGVSNWFDVVTCRPDLPDISFCWSWVKNKTSRKEGKRKRRRRRLQECVFFLFRFYLFTRWSDVWTWKHPGEIRWGRHVWLSSRHCLPARQLSLPGRVAPRLKTTLQGSEVAFLEDSEKYIVELRTLKKPW